MLKKTGTRSLNNYFGFWYYNITILCMFNRETSSVLPWSFTLFLKEKYLVPY